MKHLQLLGDEAAGPGGVSRALFMAGTLRELGVGLIRGDLLLYHASVSVLAWSSGTSLWAALIVPADALDVYYVPFLFCPVCPFPPCMA
jgi:hypothetical protein